MLWPGIKSLLAFIWLIVGMGAVVTGILALVRTRTRRPRRRGKGMAIFGVATGSVSLLLGAAVLAPNVLYSRPASSGAYAASKLRTIGTAEAKYVEKYRVFADLRALVA